jgi:hypothetical protein
MIATLHLCSRSRVPSFSSFGPRSLPNWAAVAVFAVASCSSPVGLDEDADGHDADPDETVEPHDGPAEGEPTRARREPGGRPPAHGIAAMGSSIRARTATTETG